MNPNRITKSAFRSEALRIIELVEDMPESWFLRGRFASRLVEKHNHLERAMSNLQAAREALESCRRKYIIWKETQK
jgi:hypothetical protein